MRAHFNSVRQIVLEAESVAESIILDEFIKLHIKNCTWTSLDLTYANSRATHLTINLNDVQNGKHETKAS